jgi:2'-5' RNA ligase
MTSQVIVGERARLFSAFVPPAAVHDHLAFYLEGKLAGVRRIPRENWHITLGFFGNGDDIRRRARWLVRRVGRRPAPRLRLAAAGSFPGVLWIGVRPDAEAGRKSLERVAQAAGAGRRGFRPHVTVARWRSGTVDRQAAQDLVESLDDYVGPWFTPSEVVLMRSDQGTSGPVYTSILGVPLADLSTDTGA